MDSSFPVKNKSLFALRKYRHNIVAIYLFGSCATGQVSPISDVDIAVLLKGNDKTDAHRFRFAFYADMSRVLQRNDIDVVILNTSKNLILQDTIVREGRLLYSADDEARIAYEVRTMHMCMDFKQQRKRNVGM
ncbi:MAG: nucleotidyltransferase domain-containing protein [Geobacteraceae bacterium]|nr:nucleotidyltransferase domain-containing protein [Geobacteraceae bacterium]